MKKEGQLNRDQQPFPLRVCQPEVRQIKDASRHAPVRGLAMTTEQDRAGLAHTGQLPPLRLDQVLVDVAQFDAAEIAAFDNPPSAREPLERCERAIWRCFISRVHPFSSTYRSTGPKSRSYAGGM